MGNPSWLTGAYGAIALHTAPTSNPPKLSPEQDVATVVKCRQGRSFITTAIGEIAIAGDNLRFWRSGQEANLLTTCEDLG